MSRRKRQTSIVENIVKQSNANDTNWIFSNFQCSDKVASNSIEHLTIYEKILIMNADILYFSKLLIYIFFRYFKATYVFRFNAGWTCQ